ncbi:TYRO protein tyrosine kinase-binding protein isoform X1 [Scyliorhinus canicula]|uniref:TYRO protein tyrosine kinase-binding protein isoform X1 n=1 Tax=Scyliorhinus canicula TaxID=7830 RepID=UPI0018F63C4D|nr:TYRO protein tyrosine kinase-binding protein isoform X1 [Scyliorhinus canicula]
MKRILSTLVTISLLFGVTAAEAEGKVTIDGTSVILHCPQIFKADSISWYKIDKDGNEKVEGGNGYEFTILDYSESDDGGYGCKDAASKYKFYIKVKVCKGCIELNTGTVIGIISGDLLVTFLVALSVYCFAKRKGTASKDYRHEQLGAQNVPLGRGPNIAASHQQSEYAPIKSGQRDLYDKLQR